MAFTKENRPHIIYGLLFVSLFAAAATMIAETPPALSLHISPLVLGLVIGMFYANALSGHLPKEWGLGIAFASSPLLKYAIILFGFRLSFQNILDVGGAGFLLSIGIIFSTLILGYVFGRFVLKVDRETAILTAIGSSICGGAAILATESFLKSPPHKAVAAISSIILFGTLSMFLYPIAYQSGWLDLTPDQMGAYIGGTLYGISQVIGTGKALSEEIAQTAIIVKMIRIMLLAPVLIGISFIFKKHAPQTKVPIPWFAFGFIGVIGFNSLNILSTYIVEIINSFTNFLLTMSITALGMETSLRKLQNLGMKPFFLGLFLFVWLILSGYVLVKFLY
tara:strand:+ start:453 stop:1460 length:1008 start_codon:yes stop_codon:yes gene_type:complete